MAPDPVDRGDPGLKEIIRLRMQEEKTARSQAPGSPSLAPRLVIPRPSRPTNLAPGASTLALEALTQGDPRPVVDFRPLSPDRQHDPSTLPFMEKRDRFRMLLGQGQAQQQTGPLLKAPAPAASSAQTAPMDTPSPALQRTASAPYGNGTSRGFFFRRRRRNSNHSICGAPEAYLPHAGANTSLQSHPINSPFTTDSEGSASGSPTLVACSLAAAAAAAEKSAVGSPSLDSNSSGFNSISGGSLGRFLESRVSLASTNGSSARTPRSSTASSVPSSLPSSRRGSNASGSGSSGSISRRASRDSRQVQFTSPEPASQLDSIEVLMSDVWHGNSSSNSCDAWTQAVGTSVGSMYTKACLPALGTCVETQTAPTPSSAVSTQTAPPAVSSINVQACLAAPGSAVSTQTAPPAVTMAGTQTVSAAISSSSTQCSLAAPGSCVSTQTASTAVTSAATQADLPEPALESVGEAVHSLTAALATAEAWAEANEAEAQQAAAREAAECSAHSATQLQLQLAQSAAAEAMGQVGQLTAQLQVLEGQVEALYSLGGQEDELDQLQGQVMMMQGQQTALVGQVSALEGQVASRGALVQCLTEQLLEVEEERRELQVTLQEVLEATDATHLDGAFFFNAQLAPARPRSVSFGTQSDPLPHDAASLTTADPGTAYWDSQADAFELEPELLLSTTREPASSINNIAAAPTPAAAAAAQRPKVVTPTLKVVPSKPTSGSNKAKSVAKTCKKTSSRSSISSNSRAASPIGIPTGSLSCCMLLLVAACFLGCSSIGSEGQCDSEVDWVTTTAAYVVGPSSSILVATHPLSQANSQLHSHWGAGGTSKGDSNSVYAMSWHAHVLAASSSAATAAVAGSKHNRRSSAPLSTGQAVAGMLMPMTLGVTLSGFNNSTALALSAPARTAAVQVKARESACFVPLLPQCQAGDITCQVVAPVAAAAAVPAWWMQQCVRGETACPAVPAAADAAAAHWWLHQCERGEASCPTSITAAAMWWQQKEGSQRELTTTAPAAPPSAHTAPAAGADSVSSISDRGGCSRLSPAVAEALEPASVAAALVLQLPWTFLTYQQGPAVRLAAQFSSGFFPLIIMGVVGHVFEC